ncbi:hypothetical protein Tco_1141837 [Tanacetum coccineum]
MIEKDGLDQCNAVDIPMVKRSKLDEDPNGSPVDPTRYQSMVSSLMCLTEGHLDLVFAVCTCARYLAMPTEKNLTAVKRVFRYLKEPLIWEFGCQDLRKSTSGSAQFLGEKIVSWSPKKQSVLRYHFIKEQVENEIVELYFVKTAYQVADISTKALAREHFKFLIKCLSMQSISLEQLKHLAESDEE